jgi:hypothetical protein
MEHARPHTSNMHPDMATTNRGSVLFTGQTGRSSYPAGRLGRGARNAQQHPADFVPGSQGDTGINAVDSLNDIDGDWDADPMGCS